MDNRENSENNTIKINAETPKDEGKQNAGDWYCITQFFANISNTF